MEDHFIALHLGVVFTSNCIYSCPALVLELAEELEAVMVENNHVECMYRTLRQLVT